MQVSISSWGLDCSIKQYRAVPDSAAIFYYCKNGDIKSVQALFNNSLASPWDTNSKGFTLLFVSPSVFKLFQTISAYILRWLQDMQKQNCVNC